MADYVDAEKVARRRTGRLAAMTVCDLMTGEAADLDPEALAAFWEQIRSVLNNHAPQAPTVIHQQIPPMSDAECIAFEKEKLTFGVNSGRTVGEVANNNSRYLTWLADQQFTDKLRRYLKNRSVRRQLGLDDEPEDEEENA